MWPGFSDEKDEDDNWASAKSSIFEKTHKHRKGGISFAYSIIKGRASAEGVRGISNITSYINQNDLMNTNQTQEESSWVSVTLTSNMSLQRPSRD
jgi:hypothetical protein